MQPASKCGVEQTARSSMVHRGVHADRPACALLKRCRALTKQCFVDDVWIVKQQNNFVPVLIIAHFPIWERCKMLLHQQFQILHGPLLRRQRFLDLLLIIGLKQEQLAHIR